MMGQIISAPSNLKNDSHLSCFLRLGNFRINLLNITYQLLCSTNGF